MKNSNVSVYDLINHLMEKSQISLYEVACYFMRRYSEDPDLTPHEYREKAIQMDNILNAYKRGLLCHSEALQSILEINLGINLGIKRNRKRKTA